jgi:hypothetical protein
MEENMENLICALCGVILILFAVCAYLAVSLWMTTEELKSRARRGLQIPSPVVWDYTKDAGWVDAEVEDDVAEP